MTWSSSLCLYKHIIANHNAGVLYVEVNAAGTAAAAPAPEMSQAGSHSNAETEPSSDLAQEEIEKPQKTAKVESVERGGPADKAESNEDVLADLSIYRSASDATKTKALTSELPGSALNLALENL